MTTSYLFTSESVGEGHPDKVCDQISDALLDAYLAQDKESRIALECFAKNNEVTIGGEVSSFAEIDVAQIVRKTICEIGYDRDELQFNGNNCKININISRQSSDIAQGVDEKDKKEQGAGDQGIMFGYATNESEDYLPLTLSLSHKILLKLSKLRREGKLPFIRPDAKSQVTFAYQDGKPRRVDAVVLSAQHSPDISLDELRKSLIEEVIQPVCGSWLDSNTKYFINPTGRFVLGGPAADTGLTGRKIIVDTYGGAARHGGGCFSGKDPSKVDRSAAYITRYIAKNIVASGIAEKCEVQLAYAIGIAAPVSLYVNCFGTSKIPESKIIEIIRKHFPLKPAEIIKHLNLKRPIYKKTASYGHFGRSDPDFTWEKLDKVNELKKYLPS
ncbi:MAG: methionine adenosyltransferase [Nanoarchaeota archaeon]|nr:methionine adenosyltransferase [Nanoarchaeota archaeon]